MTFVQKLNRPIDNSSLVLFRIFFGLLMFFESIGAILTGWLNETFVEPSQTFNFMDFEFLQVLVGPQMIAVYILMGLLGLMIAFGWHYRFAIISFSILWGATYFLQKSHYNNHYYLVWLIALMMIIMPANAYRSLDVKQGRVKESLTCPQWCTWFFIAQIAIVYFYASIAKFYPDWLDAKPIGIWFTSREFAGELTPEFKLWGDGLAETLRTVFHDKRVHYAFSYAGIFFDLLIIPAFLWKRTRTLALFASLGFHLLNSAIFEIGVFPYFAMAFVVFFYSPEKMRRLFFKKKPSLVDQETTSLNSNWGRFQFKGILQVGIYIYLLIQVLLPLRHHLIPGDVLWTEEGHRLSWRMMLRSKSSYASFRVEHPESNFKEVVPMLEHVSPNQRWDVYKKPDMMYQFAQRLEKHYKKEHGFDDVEVYVDSRVGVNGRPMQQFTDPEFDITSVKWKKFGHQEWILERPF